MAAFGNENVGWLDVAVNNTFGMRSVQRISDFHSKRKQQLQLHGPPGDVVLQRGPVQEFHGDEGLLVFLTDVMDGADVGMV